MLSVEPACEPYLACPLVVGLSGGRDSVALLRVLLLRGCCVHVCHVHHGIRGLAADEDARWCRSYCERLGVPYREARVDVPALASRRGLSLETAARLARRAELVETARLAGIRCVALAHHADDQAETVLFRLARGAVGTRGMAPVHEAEGVIWLRPLLSNSRAQITAWLRRFGETWVEDATNAVPDVTRNRLRLEVLPLLDDVMRRDVAPILCRSARLQTETLEALEEALKAMPLTDPQGRLYLPALQGRGSSFCRAVVLRYLKLAGVPHLTESAVSAVLGILPSSSRVSRCNLPCGFRAVRREKRLAVELDGKACFVVWNEGKNSCLQN